MKIDENWCDDPPEVGKKYWFTWWLGEPHDKWTHARIREFDEGDLAIWPLNRFNYIRSILPIPDPEPPPLPEKKL